MADIFLSYAREDEPRVRGLAADLTQLGWTVWWDERIGTAAEFDGAIERELDSAGCVVVVWSRSSVESRWVRAEAAAADDQGKLVPIRFESDVVPPLQFRQLNVATLGTASLTTPLGDAINMLAEISRLTGETPPGVDPRLFDGLDTLGGAGVSGARTVTAGKWRLTHRLSGARMRYDLDLHPNGTVSGKLSSFLTRTPLAGRWSYDSAEEVLQLEMFDTRRFAITEWLDDHTALCRFRRMKGRLERLGG